MGPASPERYGLLAGKSKLRRSKIFIAIGTQICRELRRSGIFRLNAIALTYEQDAAPTELTVVLSGAAIKISLLRSLLSKTHYDRRKGRSILANGPFVIWYLLSFIFLLALRSSLTWRNWQTRTAQDRMGQPVEVRVLS